PGWEAEPQRETMRVGPLPRPVGRLVGGRQWPSAARPGRPTNKRHRAIPGEESPSARHIRLSNAVLSTLDRSFFRVAKRGSAGCDLDLQATSRQKRIDRFRIVIERKPIGDHGL